MQAIFLDVETTGLDLFRHRILEIAFKIIDLTTGKENYTYQSIVKQPLEVWNKRDPKSISINGFTWDKILLGKEEILIKQEISEIFTRLNIERGKAVYICQNPSFDRSFFSQLIDSYTQERSMWPYHWLDFASMYWALQIRQINQNQQSFPQEMNLSKNAIAQQHQLPTESYPHSALNGVNHLILCYKQVVGLAVEKKAI